jgi:hypothetical protein
VVGDPDAVSDCDVDEGDDADSDGEEVVVDDEGAVPLEGAVTALKGLELVAVSLPFVWPFGCDAIWPWVWASP